MRMVRLSLGIFVLVEALNNYDILFAFIGAIFTLQALVNIGCCGVGGCEVNQPVKGQKSFESVDENTTFTEVK